MKVFVTGGAGFIGSSVTRILLDEGHDVTVYDNLSSGHASAVDKRARLIQSDMEDTQALMAALPGHDAVIHMAAFIAVGESVKKPVAFAENNVVNAVRLLEAMHQTGVSTIVFSSSATVYGEPKDLPLTEAAPLGIAANPYGASKVATEFFCQAFQALYGFNTIILRYFNPYGPGELHTPESHAIPNFIASALADKPVPLFWHGEQTRDFIYIDDLARAHTAVLTQKGLQIFNVGTGQGVQVKEVITLLSEILGKEVAIEDLGERAGDVLANYASSRLLHEATGWRATVSLREGLAKTVDFYRQKSVKGEG